MPPPSPARRSTTHPDVPSFDAVAVALICLSEEERLSQVLQDRLIGGECDVLADALHALTGWPVVVVGDGHAGQVGWVHAGVQSPEGLIVDALGRHEPLDWLDCWAPVVDAYGEGNVEFCSDDVGIDPAEIYGWCGYWPHLRTAP